MKQSRFTQEQIIGVLKEHQAGATAADLCRKHGIKRRDILHVAVKMRRDGGFRRPQAERLGGRERQIEEAVGGIDAGRIDLEGDAGKNF